MLICQMFVVLHAFLGADVIAGDVEVPSVIIRAVERTDVPAREFGTLTAVEVHPGDKVQAGQLLLQIGDEEPLLELARARLKAQVATEKATDDVDLRFARKSLEVEQSELSRVQAGLERLPGSISAAELDQLQLNVERAALAVEQAELTLRLSKLEADSLQQEVLIAERQVERRRIVSPINGVVVEIKPHIGEWVEPGETVVRVLNMEKVQAEGFVAVKHSLLLSTQSRATLTIELPDGRTRDYVGQLTLVGQEVDSVNGQILVWAEIDNAAADLKSGMSGRLRISTRK
ncbi:MAG: HlyD family efflux transporter periplasmic adaptor subunit [Planctomycetaceae bacterium]|nr:HlyD family efflux transporter periplasmic adaptor subunit [Planctomycetaceae bacterium]